MRYFVAHLLSGDAKRYRDRVVRELHRTHHITSPKLSLPAHLTIKPPFECGLMGIVAVEKALRAYARLETAPRYTIDGYGRFGFKTIYLSVEKSPDAVRFVRALIRHINATVPWLPRTPMEGNKLHASVARHLDRKTASRIWREVGKLRPHFEARIDSLAILKFEKKKWVVRTVIRIPRTARLPLWDT